MSELDDVKNFIEQVKAKKIEPESNVVVRDNRSPGSMTPLQSRSWERMLHRGSLFNDIADVQRYYNQMLSQQTDYIVNGAMSGTGVTRTGGGTGQGMVMLGGATSNTSHGIRNRIIHAHMVKSEDHISGADNLDVTGVISKDGGVFCRLEDSISEVGNGMYKVDLSDNEMNAESITLKFSALGADDRIIQMNLPSESTQSDIDEDLSNTKNTPEEMSEFMDKLTSQEIKEVSESGPNYVTRYIDTNSNVGGDGTSWENAYENIHGTNKPFYKKRFFIGHLISSGFVLGVFIGLSWSVL